MSAPSHELVRKLQQQFNDYTSPPIALAARVLLDKDGNVVESADATTAIEGAKEAGANKSTNVTTDGASDTKYPSVKAVKTYADAAKTSAISTAATAANAAIAALVAALPTSDPAVAGRLWLNAGVLAISTGP